MSGIQEVARGAGLKTEMVADVFEQILSRIASGEDVRIKGFGTFKRRMYKGRVISTPVVSDGKPVKYSDSYVLKFHQSALAKQRLNVVAAKAGKAKKAADDEAEEKPAAKPKKGAKKAPPPEAEAVESEEADAEEDAPPKKPVAKPKKAAASKPAKKATKPPPPPEDEDDEEEDDEEEDDEDGDED